MAWPGVVWRAVLGVPCWPCRAVAWRGVGWGGVKWRGVGWGRVDDWRGVRGVWRGGWGSVGWGGVVGLCGVGA